MKNTNNNNDRLIYLSEENRFKKIPVFNRYELKSGFKCFGPALIEEKESTVFAGPDSECFVDKHLNLIMKIN
jgi:N-methylhydantoinase A/oxoprolinase/acetone carboxylase beta subunit